VARSIDNEMKRTGDASMYLDMTHLDRDFLMRRFPVIFSKCLELGIDASRTPIPVVPAAHYLCGGILTDESGRTDISRLFAIGESACTGLHGANRLASNSLLECLVMAHNVSQVLARTKTVPLTDSLTLPDTNLSQKPDAEELIVISHMWDEVRRLMWNYVGIVRSNRRLERAQARLANILSEIEDYERRYRPHPDLVELRNIGIVAKQTVRCALARKESRGIHYNLDMPDSHSGFAKDTIVSNR